VFEPFPGNYVWNLSVNLAICMVGRSARWIAPTARCWRQPPRVRTWALRHSSRPWCDMAARLVELGEEDASAGRCLSAAEKFRRACCLLLKYDAAERTQSPHFTPRREAYSQMLAAMRAGTSSTAGTVELGRLALGACPSTGCCS